MQSVGSGCFQQDGFGESKRHLWLRAEAIGMEEPTPLQQNGWVVALKISSGAICEDFPIVQLSHLELRPWAKFRIAMSVPAEF